MKTIYDDLVKLTTTKDAKAELILIAQLENKSEYGQRQLCEVLGCPWEEYQRIRRKYSKVVDRWSAEKGRKEN